MQTAEWFLPVIAEIQEGADGASSAARRIEINSKLDDFLRAHAALVVDWDAGNGADVGAVKALARGEAPTSGVMG